MNTLTIISKVITGFILLAAFAIVAAVIYHYLMDRWEKSFEKNYTEIESTISDYQDNPASRKVISARIKKLEKLPYKNPEKTDVLKRKFQSKFESTRANR